MDARAFAAIFLSDFHDFGIEFILSTCSDDRLDFRRSHAALTKTGRKPASFIRWEMPCHSVDQHRAH